MACNHVAGYYTNPHSGATCWDCGECPDEGPTVCITHGRFAPCRKQGEHTYTTNPFWVKSVRDYQSRPIEGLTWEPAHISE
jgi:hypothetical protein